MISRPLFRFELLMFSAGFLRFCFIFNCVCVSVCVCVCVCMYVSSVAYRGQKRALDALELKSPMVVYHLTWMLGTELGSSTRVVSALKH